MIHLRRRRPLSLVLRRRDSASPVPRRRLEAATSRPANVRRGKAAASDDVELTNSNPGITINGDPGRTVERMRSHRREHRDDAGTPDRADTSQRRFAEERHLSDTDRQVEAARLESEGAAAVTPGAAAEVAACTAAAAHRRDHHHEGKSQCCQPHCVQVVHLGQRAVAVCHDCQMDSGFLPHRDAERLAEQHREDTRTACVPLPGAPAA